MGLDMASKEMPNGEERYSVKMLDGSGWILTLAGETGGWQNAHYHKGVRETYIVQFGWLAFATCDEHSVYHLNIYRPGGVVTATPGEQHNVYLPSGALVHTVKHGASVGNPAKKGNDWWDARPNFDQWSKSLDEQEIYLFDGEK
jgi:hypothetical protein